MMRKANSNRQIFKIAGIFIISIFLLLIMPDSEGKAASPEWCREVSYYLFVLLAFQLFFLKWIMRDFRILPLIFIIILYLFNFPQIILYGFDLEQVDRHEGYSSIFYYSNVPDVFVIAVRAIMAIFWGFCATISFQSKNGNKVANKDVYIRVYRQPSVLLIFTIGFIADLICNVFVVITMGYADIDNVPYMNIVKYFSFLLSASVVIIFANPTVSLSTKRNVLIAFLIYKLLCMFGGYRGFALINILLVLYVYHRICLPFKFRAKHIILGLLIIQLGSGMMKGIRDTRQEGVDVGKVVTSMFDLNNNAVLALLSDFGVSLGITCEVMETTNGKPIEGTYLFGSIATVVPGSSSLVKRFGYHNMDEELGLRNAGGSLIADLVFDYGAESILWTALILGMIYGFIFERFESSLKHLSPFALAYLFPILVDLIFCARSSLAKIPREVVWYFLIIGFFTIIIPRRKIELSR